jgi:hypothetical protein
MTVTTQGFIVRLDDRYFFQTFGADGDDVRGTTIPSESAHMTYVEADILCQNLKSKNYGARVCDRYGRAATVKTLQLSDEPGLPTPEQIQSMDSVTLKRRYYSESKFREHVDEAIKQGLIKRPQDLPEDIQPMPQPTDADWDILRTAIAGEKPEVVARRFGITIPQLSARMQLASARFGALADDMHRTNHERHIFTDSLQADLAARQAKR